MKNVILKAYELVPKAYCPKYRNYHKQQNKSQVEFAHEKEVYFDGWCNFLKVGTDFEKLRQVIWIEEFKSCFRDDIKTNLNEPLEIGKFTKRTFADDVYYYFTCILVFYMN